MSHSSSALIESTFLIAALTMAEAGLAVFPLAPRDKNPITDHGFKDASTDPDQIRRWWNQNPNANIGIACGHASGGLVVIDLDDAAVVDDYMAIVDQVVPCAMIQTTGNGCHILVRCSAPCGNAKLAWLSDRTEDSGRRIRIETRGQGGYIVAAPSIHPSGRRYELSRGNWSGIPEVMPDQLERLLEAGKGFCQARYTRQQLENQARQAQRQRRRSSKGNGVIEAFNAEHDLSAILLRHGYEQAANGRMKRPGGKSASVSIKDDRSCHHSANDPLNDGSATGSFGCHDAFDVFRLLDHDGDWQSAMRAATELLGMAHASGNGTSEVIETPKTEPWPDHLDDAAFHGVAGRIVRKILPHTESDVVALLIQLLVSFGSIIGRNAYFLADGSKHYTNLFAVLIGNTSKGRKGTSYAQVSRITSKVSPGWAENCIKSGLSSGEGLIWAVRDKIMKRELVKEKGRVIDYEEVEADPGIEDKRLLVVESEFAAVLKVADRQTNTLSAIIRQAWDTGTLRTLTKNSPAQATDAHISTIGHITNQELLRLLNTTEAANGFANRFLWLCVARSKCLPFSGEIESVDFSQEITELEQAVEYGQRDMLYALDQDAKAVWQAIYPQLSEGKPGLLGSITSRAEAQVMRLALVYAVLDCSPWIRTEHLRAALVIWDYVEQSARHIFGASLGDPMADEILDALRQRPDGMTRTDISNLFGRNKRAAQISPALIRLERTGHIRRQEQKTGGRSAERWYAVNGGTK